MLVGTFPRCVNDALNSLVLGRDLYHELKLQPLFYKLNILALHIQGSPPPTPRITITLLRSICQDR